MKKLMSLLLCVFLLSGCGGKRATAHEAGRVGGESTFSPVAVPNLSLEWKKEAEDAVVFLLKNETDRMYAYGYEYWVEVQIGSTWHKTQYGPVDCPAGEYQINPGDSREHSYTLFNTPPVGQYRIVIELYSGNDRNHPICIAGDFILNKKGACAVSASADSAEAAPSESVEADTPPESEPPADEAENIEQDDGRLLPLPEGAVALTEEDLSKIRDQWFGWDSEGAPFQFANAFLTCFYESPKEIDLFCVFHNGMDSNARNISDRERELLKDHLPFPEMEAHKTAASDMDSTLLAYTGLSLQDIDRVGLDAFAYLEEYDAYYLVCSDTMWTYHDFPEGYYAPDGSLVLLCQDRLASPAPLMVLTLRPTEAENAFHGYHFYSNQPYEE